MHVILSPGPSYTIAPGDKQRNNVYSVILLLQILVLFSRVHYFIQWYIKPIMPYVKPSKFYLFFIAIFTPGVPYMVWVSGTQSMLFSFSCMFSRNSDLKVIGFLTIISKWDSHGLKEWLKWEISFCQSYWNCVQQIEQTRWLLATAYSFSGIPILFLLFIFHYCIPQQLVNFLCELDTQISKTNEI